VHVDDAEQRAIMRDELIERLREVDWSRAKHCEGIAGKFTPKGAFSIGGSKETAYAIYGALTDDTSSAYEQVRPSLKPAA
jgi:DNA sulfur modification protein DndB